MEKEVKETHEKAMVIAYAIHGSLYLNITNRCPNRCQFCIRETTNGVGYNLWLEREPTVDEIMSAIANLGDPQLYHEIVFCGYGEPLLRQDVVIDVARRLKKDAIHIRLNTNGLADLFLGYDVLPQLQGLIDIISVSLNAHDAKTYAAITRTKYGEAAFGAILDFTKRSIQYIPKVILSVVRYPGIDVDKAALVAHNLGVEFRVRELQQ